MKKLDERSAWEKEWASAFEGESIKPSENVWSTIDGVLANQEAKKYRRRAFYYQWLAAASFLFALGSIAFVLWQNPENNAMTGSGQFAETQQSQETQRTMSEAPESSLAEVSPAEPQSQQTAEQEMSPNSVDRKMGKDKAVEIPPQQKKSFYLTSASSKGVKSAIDNQLQENAASAALAGTEGEKNKLPAAHRLGLIELKEELVPMEANFQKVWLASQMISREEDENDARYWLGATIASNYFRPNFQESGTNLAGLAESGGRAPKGNETSTANIDDWGAEDADIPSINTGLQAATWLSKKWVLQGGVQYGNYHSSTTAGTYVDATTAQAYPLHYANFREERLQTASPGSRLATPVTVTNSFEFISVPLRVGYVLLDKKIGLLLSPGVSSEFFLSNRLTDDNNRLSTYTIYGGEDSPYKRVHFRALMGAQLYYKLGQHYMISIEPSYQQAITDFNKSESVFQSRPSSMGISAGFRYIIR